MPAISVIVPVYKVEPYIRRCIDSVLNQTYQDFELILVDDGSPDNCGAICDEYAEKDSRIHVIHQENSGISAARNAGLDWMFANSGSQWLTFIDSDDWVHPQYLELLWKAARESGVPISMCHFLRRKEEDLEFPSVSGNWRHMTTNEAYVQDVDGNEVSSYAWGRLYAKELFSKVRYPVGVYWEDLRTTYKVFYTCQQIAVLDDALYYYFANPSGIARAPWSRRNLDILGGYKANMAFFRKRKDAQMELRMAKAFRNFVEARLLYTQRSQLPQKEKKAIERILLRNLRWFLCRYARQLELSLETDWQIFYLAFEPLFVIYEKCPVLQKPYRFLRRIIRGR